MSGSSVATYTSVLVRPAVATWPANMPSNDRAAARRASFSDNREANIATASRQCDKAFSRWLRSEVRLSAKR